MLGYTDRQEVKKFRGSGPVTFSECHIHFPQKAELEEEVPLLYRHHHAFHLQTQTVND